MNAGCVTQTDPALSYVQQHNWVTFILARLYCCRHDRYYSRLLYTYLRTVDDRIDTMEHTPQDKKRYLSEQRELIDDLYAGDVQHGTSVIAQLVRYDRSHNNTLRPFIEGMMNVFEFDASRQHKIVSEQELLDYSLALGSAYTQLLIRFVEPRYRVQEENVQLAHACHLSHILRDFPEDLKLGYINIAKQDIDTYHIDPTVQNENFRKWLKDRIITIAEKFKKGKVKLDRIPILRIKIIARLYCFRYEAVLQQIEDADYQLQAAYHLRVRDILKLTSTLFATIFRHIWYSLGL